MTLRLPPRYYNTPTHARFRKHRLPSELWDTWELLNALAWVNDYKFTPPTALVEMAVFLTIKPDALRDRLARLQQSGWLKIDPQPGRENVYTPIVPPDVPPKPINRSKDFGGVADSCGKPASLIRNCGEDSSGTMEGNGGSDSAPVGGVAAPAVTPVVDYRGANSTAAAVCTDSSISEKIVPAAAVNNTHGRAREATTTDFQHEIADALFQIFGIEEPSASRIAAQPHVDRAYLRAWSRYKHKSDALKLEQGKVELGPAFYARQFADGVKAPEPPATREDFESISHRPNAAEELREFEARRKRRG